MLNRIDGLKGGNAIIMIGFVVFITMGLLLSPKRSGWEIIVAISFSVIFGILSTMFIKSIQVSLIAKKKRK